MKKIISLLPIVLLLVFIAASSVMAQTGPPGGGTQSPIDGDGSGDGGSNCKTYSGSPQDGYQCYSLEFTGTETVKISGVTTCIPHNPWPSSCVQDCALYYGLAWIEVSGSCVGYYASTGTGSDEWQEEQITDFLVKQHLMPSDELCVWMASLERMLRSVATRDRSRARLVAYRGLFCKLTGTELHPGCVPTTAKPRMQATAFAAEK